MISQQLKYKYDQHVETNGLPVRADIVSQWATDHNTTPNVIDRILENKEWFKTQ